MLQAFLLRAYKAKQKSGFADKPLLALGAGNGDFTFVPGEPDGLAAPGTVEILVIPVFYPFKELQETAVFLIALVGIAGKASEDGKDHKAIGQQCQETVDNGVENEHGNQADDHACTQNRQVQFIRSVTAGHKSGHTGTQLAHQISKPVTKSIHGKSPYNQISYYYYNIKKQDFNRTGRMFTDCLKWPGDSAGIVAFILLF